MPKFIEVLQARGIEVVYLTDTAQPEHAPHNTDLPEGVEVNYANLRRGLGIRDLFDFVCRTRPEIVLLQYQTFARNYLDGFFPWVIQLASPRTKVISMIHEFAGYSQKGRLRQLPALLASDRILFSDKTQLETSLPYSHHWHESKSKTLIFGHTSGSTLSKFNAKPTSTKPLSLAYHGFIQPAKGLLELLEALADFSTPYTLHILGTLEPLLDYGTLDEVTAYQQKVRNFLNTHPQVQARTILHGDVSPASPEFQSILREVELGIFPFQDGLTARRSSFLNTLLNSNALLASNCTSLTDEHLSSILNCGGASSEILDFLNDYTHWSQSQRQAHYQAQLELKRFLLSEELRQKMFAQLTLADVKT